MGFEGIAEKILELEADRFLLIERWKGGPGKILFFRILSGKPRCMSPVIYVAKVKTQKEFGKEQTLKGKSIVTIPKKTIPPIRKLATALAEFFELPLLEADSAPKLHSYMNILQNHEYEAKISFTNSIGGEIGPTLIVSHTYWDDSDGTRA